MPDDVRSLVLRTRAGDAEACEQLIRLHLDSAYATALAVLRDPGNAEDVAHDAFITALERLEECRQPERFAAWLLQIVRNQARNYLRRAGVRKTELLEEGTAYSGDDPALDAERASLRAQLSAGLEQLSETQREVVLLHDMEGWRHREIGEALGMPEGTVRYHLSTARRALRALLGSRLREEN